MLSIPAFVIKMGIKSSEVRILDSFRNVKSYEIYILKKKLKFKITVINEKYWV